MVVEITLRFSEGEHWLLKTAKDKYLADKGFIMPETVPVETLLSELAFEFMKKHAIVKDEIRSERSKSAADLVIRSREDIKLA